MRILFISTWLPYPPNTGSRIRTYNLIKSLARHHEIDLVSFCDDESETQHVLTLEVFCRHVTAVVHNPFAQRRLRSAIGLVTPMPQFLFAGHSAAMQKAVDHMLSTEQYDLMVCEVMVAASYAKNLAAPPKILDDLELTQFLEPPSTLTLFSRLRVISSQKKLIHYLRRNLGAFSVCTVPSHKERLTIESALGKCDTHLIVVPNGIDKDVYRHVVPFTQGSPYVVFNGALTFFPNYQGIKYFLTAIWPSVTQQAPQLQLRITGSYQGVELNSLALTPTVQLTGYLEDVLPMVAGAQMCVCPLLVGGGTRLKLLESMALGVPIVATSKAAEGLDFMPGEHLLIADTAEAFAASIIR